MVKGEEGAGGKGAGGKGAGAGANLKGGLFAGRVRLMTHRERAEYLDMAARGGTALAILKEMGLAVGTLTKTLAEGVGFREQVDALRQLQNQMVETAVLQAAIKGNVSAQTLWMRHRPASGWGPDEDETTGEGTGTGLGIEAGAVWERMSDAELVDYAVAAGLDLPSELVDGNGTSRGGEQPGGVPQTVATDP